MMIFLSREEGWDLGVGFGEEFIGVFISLILVD